MMAGKLALTPPPSNLIEELEAFDRHELAVCLAGLLLRHAGEPVMIDIPRTEQLSGDFRLLITRTEAQPDSIEMRAREKERETGWYLVYHPAYLKDMALWWDDARGVWLESSETGASVMRDMVFSNPRRIKQS